MVKNVWICTFFILNIYNIALPSTKHINKEEFDLLYATIDFYYDEINYQNIKKTLQKYSDKELGNSDSEIQTWINENNKPIVGSLSNQQLLKIASNYYYAKPFHLDIEWNHELDEPIINCLSIEKMAKRHWNINFLNCKNSEIIPHILNTLGTIMASYLLRSFDNIYVLAPKKLKDPLSFAEIISLYKKFTQDIPLFITKYPNFLINDHLQSFITEAFNNKYRKTQTELSSRDKLVIAHFFNSCAQVTYERIQDVFFEIKYDNYTRTVSILKIPNDEIEKLINEICDLVKIHSVDINQYPMLIKFLDEYSCPINPFLYNYIYKGLQIDRLINAVRMKNCIKIHNLKLLDVAQKCIHRQGNYLKVYAHNISAIELEPLSLTEVQELIKFTMLTGYQDWGTINNCLRNRKTKQLIFIDTEDKSFNVHTGQMTALDYLNLLKTKISFTFSPEAKEWFTHHLEDIKNNPTEANKVITRITDNFSYDPANIDFEQVKKEYKDFRDQAFKQK